MSEIIGGGIVPAAIEMMDALAIEAAEAATHCGYPPGAGAVLVIELDGPTVNQVVDTLKHLEHEGYHFEVADASLELLMRRTAGWEPSWFRVESFRVITDDASPTTSAGEAPDEQPVRASL